MIDCLIRLLPWTHVRANQGCQRVNSQITQTRIALTRSHTDHSQQVTRFPRVSRIKSLMVCESLALNCNCPFISDIALTPATVCCTATDHHCRLPLTIPSCSPRHACWRFPQYFAVIPCPSVIILWHLIFIFMPSYFLLIPTWFSPTL